MVTIMRKPPMADPDTLRADWNRSRDLKLVAQLHACSPRDVVAALDLADEEVPARYRSKTQPNGKHWGKVPWEELHPQEAAKLYDMMANGAKSTEAGQVFCLSPARANAVYKRMKERKSFERSNNDPGRADCAC